MGAGAWVPASRRSRSRPARRSCSTTSIPRRSSGRARASARPRPPRGPARARSPTRSTNGSRAGSRACARRHTLDATSPTKRTLIVEAALEDLGLKHEIFRALDAGAADDTILASNTSALSIEAIASVTGPARRGSSGCTSSTRSRGWRSSRSLPGRSRARRRRARRGRSSGPGARPRSAAPTRPGFIVNRVNRPFTIEALRLLEAGEASVEAIDKAMRDAGFPMGPFELMDLTGIDVTLAAARGVWEGLGQPDRLRPSPIQERLVAAGPPRAQDGRRVLRVHGRPPRRGRAPSSGVAAGESSMPAADIEARRSSRPSRTRRAGRSPTASPRRPTSTWRCGSGPAIRPARSSGERPTADAARGSRRVAYDGRPGHRRAPTTCPRPTALDAASAPPSSCRRLRAIAGCGARAPSTRRPSDAAPSVGGGPQPPRPAPPRRARSAEPTPAPSVVVPSLDGDDAADRHPARRARRRGDPEGGASSATTSARSMRRPRWSSAA